MSLHTSRCPDCRGTGECHHPGLRRTLSGHIFQTYDPQDEEALPCDGCNGTGTTLVELTPLQERALGALIEDQRTGSRHTITHVPDMGGWFGLDWSLEYIISTREFCDHYRVAQRPARVEVGRFKSIGYHEPRSVIEGWEVMTGGPVALVAAEEKRAVAA